MAEITIHDDQHPDGRPATDDEIADLIIGADTAQDVLKLFAHMEAADGFHVRHPHKPIPDTRNEP
jgi:hypothetical protein